MQDNIHNRQWGVLENICKEGGFSESRASQLDGLSWNY